MTTSIHYLNGQESALVKLGFMGLNPEQWQHAGLRAAGGGAAGAGIGALAADDNDGLQGAMLGGLAGAAGAGGASVLGKNLEIGPALAALAGVKRPHMGMAGAHEAARIADGISGAGAGGTMAGGAAMGALPAILAGRSTRDGD